MNNLKRKRWSSLILMAFVSYFTVMAFLVSGCEPLRKKFTRKKKQEAEEATEIPVLEPMEYPKKVYNVEEDYKNRYTLWRAWHKELIESIAENEGQKRKLYHLNQTVTQLTAMQNLLLEEKGGMLKDILGKYKKLQMDIEAPVSLRDATSWKNELDSIENKIRDNYSFSKVQSSIKK